MKHLIIGTAGHIDHGKTSLIKMLSGIDCDTHKAEKERGITINLGFSHLDLPTGNSIGIIDMPGHKDFINTMISGAGSINLVLLLIAADEGIMPQTTEHLNIINALGIKNGIIVLSKIDLVDDELIEIAKSEIKDFLKDTILENSPIISISSKSGLGKQELIDELENFVAKFQNSEIKDNFRMYIDRLFVVKGHGNVVTGSVIDGKLKVGDEVFINQFNAKPLRVRAIEKHGKPVESVQKGDRAAINLIGVKQENLEKGLLISKYKIQATKIIDVYIKIFKNSPEIKLWNDIIFLSGSYQSTAKLHLLNKNNLRGSEEAVAQIHLNKEFYGQTKDKFIFRNSSDDISIGGGFIIDEQPLHHKRNNTELSKSLMDIAINMINGNDFEGNILRIIEKQARPFDIQDVSAKLQISKKDITNSLCEKNENIIIYNNEVLIYKRFNKMFQDKILNSLKDFHKKNYIFDIGMKVDEILGKLNLEKSNLTKQYLKYTLESLNENNEIENFNNTWIIKNHKANIDSKTKAELNWLETEFLNYKDEKPVIPEIEEKAVLENISSVKFKLFLNFLVYKNILITYNGDYMHKSIFQSAKTKLLDYLNSKPNGISIPEYKEIIIGTKKFRGFLSDVLESEGLIQFSKDENLESVLSKK